LVNERERIKGAHTRVFFQMKPEEYIWN